MPPLPCVSTAVAAKRPPLPCVSTACVADPPACALCVPLPSQLDIVFALRVHSRRGQDTAFALYSTITLAQTTAFASGRSRSSAQTSRRASSSLTSTGWAPAGSSPTTSTLWCREKKRFNKPRLCSHGSEFHNKSLSSHNGKSLSSHNGKSLSSHNTATSSARLQQPPTSTGEESSPATLTLWCREKTLASEKCS